MPHGPEPSPFEQRLAGACAGTHALVNLDCLAGNVDVIRRELLPPGAGLMAVVKANAYGHGYIPCARAALEAGAASLAVARVEEALLLRRAGIAAPILVVGPPNARLAPSAVRAGVALAIGSLDSLRAVARELDDTMPPARVHLKIDSGMRRFGADPGEAREIALAIAADPRFELEGLFTHFATADEDDQSFLNEQVRRFSEARRAIVAAGIDPPRIHLANSAAALRRIDVPGVTDIRMGVSLYGLSPSACVQVIAGFRPLMTFRTRIFRTFTLGAGEGISYGLTYAAAKSTRVAMLPVGYADGFMRTMGNRAWVSVNGHSCPIRGRICMDQTMVEIDQVREACEGDEVILFGDGSSGEMTADQVAAFCGTINYEVVCAVSARVPRVYLRGGRAVALQDLEGIIERPAGEHLTTNAA